MFLVKDFRRLKNLGDVQLCVTDGGTKHQLPFPGESFTPSPCIQLVDIRWFPVKDTSGACFHGCAKIVQDMCQNRTEPVLRGMSRIFHNVIGETYCERCILHSISFRISELGCGESVKLTSGKWV